MSEIHQGKCLRERLELPSDCPATVAMFRMRSWPLGPHVEDILHVGGTFLVSPFRLS